MNIERIAFYECAYRARLEDPKDLIKNPTNGMRGNSPVAPQALAWAMDLIFVETLGLWTGSAIAEHLMDNPEAMQEAERYLRESGRIPKKAA